ncbi:MAG: PqqD family protein [Deltaproteobacteria bacterium]|nr:PqqD family protein [Deltaproteobacteria bacterium]
MSQVHAGARPRAAARCAWQAVEGEAVVIDLETRRVLGLNRTGSLVWSRMDGRRTVAELSQDVAAAFQVAPETASRDVEAFLAPLVARGLVELA